MTNRKWVLMVCGAAALTLVTAAGSFAFVSPSKANYVTFDRTVALPGVVLTAGAYAFELMEGDSGSEAVRVLTRDRTRVLFLGFTRRVERPRKSTADVLATFGEARPGQPIPIAAWYPIHASSGYAFIYSEQ